MPSGRLDDLRGRFRERCQGDLVALEDWAAANYPPSEGVEKLVHNLAGAGGTLGFSQVSQAAARLDDRFYFKQPVDRDEVASLLDALRAL